MSYSKVLNKSRILSTILQPPKVSVFFFLYFFNNDYFVDFIPHVKHVLFHFGQIKQTCYFHRLAVSKRPVSLAPYKFLISDFRQLTVANLNFVRHSSGEGFNQSERISTVASDNQTIDLSEDVIPDAPELPTDAAIDQVVEKVLVYYFI